MTDGKDGESRGRRQLWPLFVGLPLIAIIAVAAVVFAGGEESAPRNAGQEQQPSGEEQASRSGDESGGGRLGHPSLGEADAPVVMVEYSDYQ